MAHKKLDPLETYVVMELFGCGEGHSMGRHFTHWEEGEACIMGHERGISNEGVHLYWRKYLVPKFQGRPDNPYAQDTPTYAELLDRPENNSKWLHVIPAPKKAEVGDEFGPGQLSEADIPRR